MNKETIKVKLIDEQKAGEIFFIIVLFVVLYLLEKKKESNINHCINPDTKNLALNSKYLMVLVYSIFLYISTQAYNKSRAKADYMAFIASIIALIPPIIMVYAFYVAKKNPNVYHPLL